jgi:cytochrome c-type biogenesis protein CcmH/NrfG
MRNQSVFKTNPALFVRTAACYALLYQAGLLAGELVNPLVFAVLLAQGAALPFVVKKLPLKPVYACIVLFCAFPAVRLFISFLRVFSYAAFSESGDASAFLLADALLLAFDSNNYVAVFPVYWLAFTGFFAARSREAARITVVLDLVLLCLMFTIFNSSVINAYKWPIFKIIVFCAILFFEMLALLLSISTGTYPKRKETLISVGLLLAIACGAGVVLFKPLEESALEKGGGLLRPQIFSFDFAPFLRLENEITMNDDLIFILRKKNHQNLEPEDWGFDLDDETFLEAPNIPVFGGEHKLMRRFVLSAYDSKNGFTRDETVDEKIQNRLLPRGKTAMSFNGEKKRSLLEQEYYLVNIDGEAFLAMSEPVSVVPFEHWDASSFKSAYKVESMTSDVTYHDLIYSLPEYSDFNQLGLSAEDYAWFTAYGDKKKGLSETEKRITELSESLTLETNNYWEKIQNLYDYLKYGDFLYSLKPGVSPDGDQLAYFLFEAKRGYCSYFAFSFASMLRSIGIPCRISVGFFLDPLTERFGFYPVAANMAHAWVDVWFPEYGWIEYDPTTEELAADEQWTFSQGPPSELLERLMKEILDNYGALKEKQIVETNDEKTNLSLQQTVAFAVSRFGPWIVLLALLFFFIRWRFILYFKFLTEKDCGKKTLYLYAYAKRLLVLAGFDAPFWGEKRGFLRAYKTGVLLESLWIKKLPFGRAELGSFYENVQKARFAPKYTPALQKDAEKAFLRFVSVYKKNWALWKRVLGVIVPPFAAFYFRAEKRKAALRTIVLCVCFLFVKQGGLFSEEAVLDAEKIYLEAQDAQAAQYWEKAIDLWTQGGKAFPEDSRFTEALGDLYFSREFYRLAKAEYQKAEKIKPENVDLLYKLAQTTGSLNENRQSAAYLERILQINPDDHESIILLGWMYFKLHKLIEGEALITSAIERLGGSPDLAMMLGTINSDLLRYEESKQAYLEAVASAVGLRRMDFAATANYNFSILESRFYKYNEAFERARQSLDASNRASGHLALGELYIRRLDWKAGIAEYQTAYDMDKSPLSKLSLADTFRMCGRLEEARIYAEDCLKQSDHAWMLNYGIDPNQYKRDIHEILYRVYGGLKNQERFLLQNTLVKKAQSFWKKAVCLVKEQIHKNLFYKYSLLSANEFKNPGESEPPPLEALLQYYKAFGAYPLRSVSYLRLAGLEETRKIPAARSSYLFFEGDLLKKRALLEQALAFFDPLWERDMLAETYTTLCRINPNNSVYAGKLYALNPGALRQNGIRLPALFQIKGAGASALERRLKKCGFSSEKPSSKSRYIFNINLEERGVSVEFFDSERGFALTREFLTIDSKAQKDKVALANRIAKMIFEPLARNSDSKT